MSVTFYRTRDGQADYKFSFERQLDNNYRIVILDMPSYQRRDTGFHTTHHLTDGQGRYYVCWTGALRSEDDAKKVAALWADLTQTYIKTGKTIDAQVASGIPDSLKTPPRVLYYTPLRSNNNAKRKKSWWQWLFE